MLKTINPQTKHVFKSVYNEEKKCVWYHVVVLTYFQKWKNTNVCLVWVCGFSFSKKKSMWF